MDTIFALATVPGRSGVAVIRISGSKAEAVCATLCGSVPKGRGVRQLHDPTTGRLLDEPLVLFFEQGKSFTGEPIVELHLHGSRAVVQEVLSVLSSMDGLRLADAGEFTRRALENGKLDLTEVEGLADLIDAETSAQHQQAIRVFSGELGNLAESWRADLIRAAALLEASIDFADEDVPEDVVPEVIGLMDRVSGSLRTQIGGVKAAERVRDGFEIAIVGKPNVGKSTLLNHLAGRTAAITSDIPGTTRDVIEVRMEIGGYAVTLSDTAGVRDAEDKIEQLGVDLALDRARQSDLNILLVDGVEHLDIATRSQDIVVQAKGDLANVPGLSVSGKTGEGIPQLIGLIEQRLNGLVAGAGLAIRERHRVAMVKAEEALIEARRLLGEEGEFDIVAEELRFGLAKVSSIVGHVDVEDLLDEIFSSFCIGK